MQSFGQEPIFPHITVLRYLYVMLLMLIFTQCCFPVVVGVGGGDTARPVKHCKECLIWHWAIKAAAGLGSHLHVYWFTSSTGGDEDKGEPASKLPLGRKWYVVSLQDSQRGKHKARCSAGANWLLTPMELCQFIIAENVARNAFQLERIKWDLPGVLNAWGWGRGERERMDQSRHVAIRAGSSLPLAEFCSCVYVCDCDCGNHEYTALSKMWCPKGLGPISLCFQSHGDITEERGHLDDGDQQPGLH